MAINQALEAYKQNENDYLEGINSPHGRINILFNSIISNLENLMDNETKLKIGFFDYPILFLRFLYTFVILGRHGFFSLTLKLDFWPKKI